MNSNKRKSIAPEAQECSRHVERVRYEHETDIISSDHENNVELEESKIDGSHLDINLPTPGSAEASTIDYGKELATKDERSKGAHDAPDQYVENTADKGSKNDRIQSDNVDDMQSDIEDNDSEQQDTETGTDEDGEDEDDLELFRPVMAALNLSRVEQFALLLRLHQMQCQSDNPFILTSMLDFSCKVAQEPMSGAFNLAYQLTFSDGVVWIARIPGHGTRDRFGDLDAKKMDAEYQTMRHIKANTSVPIPEVFHWETSCKSIGAPFALMSFVHGQALSEVWDMKLSEQQRLNILSNVAQAMVQFSKLSFDQKGMLAFDHDGNVEGVGQEIQMEPQNFMPWYETKAQGPYDTMTEALADSMAEAETEDLHIHQRSDVRLLRLALDSIPEYLIHESRFTVTPCDLSYQNVFVDPVDHRITGLIDWDSVGTEGSCSGYARYPSWITRDWDPIMYDYNAEALERGEESFDQSPETLSKYRQHYAAAFEKVASELKVDGYDPRMTRLSHIMEAFLNALTNCTSRPLVMEKLLDHAFKGKVPFTKMEYANDFEAGDTSEKDALVEGAFATMWHTEWEESSNTGNDCKLSDTKSLTKVAAANRGSNASSNMSKQEDKAMRDEVLQAMYGGR